MNKDLQSILNILQQSKHLSDEEKKSISKSLEEANKGLEDKTHELEIESALERVRTAALAMKEPADMVDICHVISDQLELLNVKEIRNIQTAIFYESKGTYFNFEFYSLHNKSLVTEVEYKNHPMSAEFADQMLSGSGGFFTRSLEGKELKNWYAFQQTTNQFADSHLAIAPSLNYYWYSMGPVALGISTYVPLNEQEIILFKRFYKVFELAYRRYLDIEKAEAQAREAEDALTELRATQTQLIQAEKMASLGELTAGIAHEIQNPLNFVNNFSELSNELIDEMQDELAKGNNEDAIAIAADVKQNLEKINHHGKRADAIVKGMLQHSRSSTGQKELTDINSLTDEYVRLCYHGLRAKEKSFTAAIKTEFDPAIKKINIVPQDIGRVILNLLTNAFYAVNEKKKLNVSGYEPTVSIITKKIDDKVLIRIKDNGNGISPKVLNKIFQPFFTTKPTGQGTGLGLSLSYDIIKAHGGEIKVETRESEGTTFIIHLTVTDD